MMFRGDRETLRRLHSVRADRLEDLGRASEAAAVRERIGEGPRDEPEDDVEVYDIEDEYDQEQSVPEASDAAGTADAPEPPDAPPAGVDESRGSESFAERVEAEMTELIGEDDEPDDQEA